MSAEPAVSRKTSSCSGWLMSFRQSCTRSRMLTSSSDSMPNCGRRATHGRRGPREGAPPRATDRRPRPAEGWWAWGLVGQARAGASVPARATVAYAASPAPPACRGMPL
eukprot:2609541-Prymnesium_polylepis.2